MKKIQGEERPYFRLGLLSGMLEEALKLEYTTQNARLYNMYLWILMHKKGVH